MIDETQLIEQILSGEEEGITTFVKVYATKLKGFLGSYYPSTTKEDREEVVQDTLHKAIKKIGTFDSAKARFGTWLATIAVNTVRDRWRKEKRIHKVEVAEEEAVELPLDEIRQMLDEKLKPREREILEWSAEGISQAQMADRLGISEDNVKVIKCRAMKKCREILLVCKGEEERNSDDDLVQKGTGRPNIGNDPSAGLSQTE